MAINFTALLDQEIAKIEERKRIAGKSATPVLDKFTDAWQLGQYQREYNEKKRAERSEDAMKIMGATAGEYTTNYDNASLDQNISRLENYVAKNKGKFDATAMDFYDLTLNSMKDQKALNIDFLQYQERLPEETEKMNEYLRGLDKDKVWTAENINELKKMQAPLVNFSGQFRAKHGKRLASKAYEDYNLQLDNMQSMNSFLLQSATDDGFLREDEMNAYTNDMFTGNTDASKRLNQLEDVKLDSQIKTVTARMGEQMSEVDMFKKFKAGETSIPTDGMGNYDPNGQIPMTWEELSLDDRGKKLPQDQIDSIHDMWNARIDSKIDALNITDKSYQTITTEGSYVEGVAPGLTDKIGMKKKEKKTTVVPTTAEQKIADIEAVQEERKTAKEARETASKEYLGRSRTFIQDPSKGLGYALKKDVFKGMAEEGLISDSDYSRWMTSGIPTSRLWTDKQMDYMEQFVNSRAEKIKDRYPDKAVNLLESFQNFKTARKDKLQYMEWDEKAKRYVKKKK